MQAHLECGRIEAARRLAGGADRPCIYLLDPSTGITGAFRSAQRQARCLAGVAEVVLAIPSANSVEPGEFEPFAKVVRLPLATLRRTPAGVLLYLPRLLYSGWKLRRAMLADGCERLQVNDYYVMEGAVARLFGFRGRIVTWVRIDPANYGGPVAKVWLKIAGAVSSHIVAVSRFIARLLPGELQPHVVYDPLPRPCLPSGGRMPDRRFVYVGNYIPGKGQDLAIAAFEQLVKQFPHASLHFYGGDMGLAKNRSHLESLKSRAISGPAAARIHFQPFVDDVCAPLDGALAALNFSRSESFSLTCQEASNCGVAVIATRCGGPEEIVEDGVTGYLVPVGDVAAMADRMRRLLADPALAAAMGRRGAELVRSRFADSAVRSALAHLFALPTTSSERGLGTVRKVV